MTYHRTTGKGGTVNSSRDEPFPNYNKSTVGGNTAPTPKGKRVWPNKSVPSGPSRTRRGS